VVNSDQVISVTSEEVSSISRPGEASAVWNNGVLSNWWNIQLDFINHAFGFQIPNLDALGCGSAEPVSVGGEDKGVDNITGLKRVKSLALSKIPQHSNTIFTTRGTEGSIWGNSNSVQVSGVSREVGAEFAVAERPNLDKLIPTSRNNDWGSWGRRESDAGNPFGVSIFNDGEFAFTEGVPQLNSAITRSRDNLTVVSTESNREDILGVSNEAAGANTRVDVPETKGVIP
jgi:hypothetical protein